MAEIVRFEAARAEIEELVRRGIAARLNDPLGYKVFLCHAVIQLHDAWARTCRAVICKSAIGSVSTLGGMILRKCTSIHRRDHVIDWLQNNWTSKKMARTWEPDWHVPAQAIRAAQLLGVQNLATISAAFGASIEADNIRITRNVVAHTLPATWRKLRDYQKRLGLTGRESIPDFLLVRPTLTGPMLIDIWISDCNNCLRAAIV